MGHLPKERDSDYATVNPHNFHPVFTNEQLASSLRATTLITPVLRAMSLMDIEQLHSDIRSALPADSIASIHLNSEKSDPRWSLGSDGLLRRDDRIYVPDSEDLQLQVLRYKHDHLTTGHFSQNRTITLV